MKFSLVTLLLFFSSSFYAQFLTTDWGVLFESKYYPGVSSLHMGKGVSIVSDADGNVYVASLFVDTLALAGISDTVTLVSTGQNDGVIAKFNSNGACLWAHKIGGTGRDFCNIITITSDSSLIIGGGFSGQVDFDPSSNDSICNSTYAYDLFFLKLSMDGDFEWVRILTGTAPINDCIHGISENSDDDLILVGEFSGTMDFDPGLGQSYVASGTGFGSPRAIFLAKYNLIGELVWINKIGGGSPADIPYDLELDNDDNIVIAGLFMSASMDMDPSSGTSFIYNSSTNSGTDGFLAKYDIDGNHLWSGSFGGQFSDETRTLAINSSNEIVITGQYNGNIDFDITNNTHVINSGAGHSEFMSKYLPSGQLLWARLLSPNYLVRGSGFDQNGNIYLTGSFLDTVTIDGHSITATGQGEIFITGFSMNGNCIWSNSIGGPNGESPFDLILDQDNDIIIGGGFNGQIDLDPSQAVYEFIGESTLSNFFIAKYSLGELGLEEQNSAGIIIYPNPNTGDYLNIVSQEPWKEVELFDILGKCLITSNNGTIDLSQLESGEYFLCVKGLNGFISNHKLIIRK